MTGNGKRWLAAATVLAFAALFVGVGIRLSWADEPKTADLTELRDAVKAASKRGDNVDEVEKALAAFEKAMGKGFKSELKDPPAELSALRNAVEAASRKGENVEDIRKQLDAVEMKLLGRVLVAPKPSTPPLGDPPPARPDPPLRRFPNEFRVRPGFDFPAFPNMDLPKGQFGGIDREALEKSMELHNKALELLLKDPDDAEARKLQQQAMEQMLKAMGGGRGGIFAPDMLFPELGGFGRVNERFRFGIRMEKVTPVAAEQLGIEAGRGIAVTDVIAGSAAEKAGIKPHDIILEFAGKPVSDSTEEFNQQVTAVKAGERISAVVLRKGKKVEIKGIELPDTNREIPRANRRVPQLRLPNPVPELGPRPGENGLTVTLGRGNFSLQSTQDGTTYDLKGTTENGQTNLTEITIDADGKATKYESIDKVPAEHKPAIEKLLKTVGVGKPEVRLRPKVKD